MCARVPTWCPYVPNPVPLMLLERLIENVGLGVDVFATCRVAEGWRLRLPALDWATFHYTVQGEGEVGDGGGRLEALSIGSLAVVPPQLVHILQCGAPPYGEVGAGSDGAADGDSPVRVVNHQAGPADDPGLLVACGRVDATYAGGKGLFDQLRQILVLDFADDPAMRLTFTNILEEMQGSRPGFRAMVSALMRECLIRVLRQLCLQNECTIPWLSAVEDPNLAPALDEMFRRPGHPHSVASLAAGAHMSRSAFARRFRESMGSPPLEYLRGVRLRHAAGLLRKLPPLPIAVVARRSGFASRSQFSRSFAAHFGCSPSDFRGAPGV